MGRVPVAGLFALAHLTFSTHVLLPHRFHLPGLGMDSLKEIPRFLDQISQVRYLSLRLPVSLAC